MGPIVGHHYEIMTNTIPSINSTSVWYKLCVRTLNVFFFSLRLSFIANKLFCCCCGWIGKKPAKKRHCENKLVCNSTSNKQNMVDSQEITPVMSILTHNWARTWEGEREWYVHRQSNNSKKQTTITILIFMKSAL